MSESYVSLWHGEIVAPGPIKPGRVATILRAVADEHEVSVSDILGPRRVKHISLARQHAMWALMKETRLSSVAVGRRLGGRDHSTVLHGVRRHEERMRARG